MAITYVNKSAFASGTAALTVGAVSGVVADDLILLFVESANQNIATPTGFTQVTNSPVSTGTAATAGGVRLAVFYRFATGADTTTSVADSGNHTTAIKMAFRGVDTATPFDATPVSAIKTPASTSSSFPGITTATANAWIVHASALDLDAASTATTGTPTNANLTGLTERHDQTISGGVGGGLVVITGEKATAGATGNTTATVTSTIQVYLTMALREQALVERTGDGAATETGNDAAASSGDVVVSGDGAVAEAGADTATVSGDVQDAAIVGTGAATEAGADVAAGAGKVLVSASGAVTEAGTDTSAAAGQVLVSGTGAATDATDSAAAVGAVLVNGTGTTNEAGQDVGASTGAVSVQGAAALSEAGEDAAAALGGGSGALAGSASAVELGPDSATGEGTSIEPAPSGRAGFEMGGPTPRKVYIKRGKRIHIFDTVEEADAWVQAEQQATQAIEKAKGKKKLKAKAKVYKALDEQLPHEVIRLDVLESMVAHFGIPVELPTLEARQDWLEVARIAMLAREMQDEEEVELLILG